MVIAIVGYAYSGKSLVAKDIQYFTEGAFRRPRRYTTRVDYNYHKHQYISEEELSKLSPDDIFYTMSGIWDYKYLTLTSQLNGVHDAIFVADDPRALTKLEQLGVPYAIIFTDGSRHALLERAESTCGSIAALKSRYASLKDSMDTFRASEKYSMYLDVFKMEPWERAEETQKFVTRFQEWAAHRSAGELHFPFICETDSRFKAAMYLKSVV